MQHIIIYSSRSLVPYLMDKCLPAKHGHGGHVERPVQRHSVACFDLLRRIGNDFWCEKIQSAELVTGSVRETLVWVLTILEHLAWHIQVTSLPLLKPSSSFAPLDYTHHHDKHHALAIGSWDFS
jgi:hypothetical protein